ANAAASGNLTVANNTNKNVFVIGDYVQVDSEIMLVTNFAGGGSNNQLQVTRGALGTTAAAHTTPNTITLAGIDSTAGVSATAGASTTNLRLTATTNFSKNDIVQIDSEKIQLPNNNAATCGATLAIPCFTGVTRGVSSTTATNHTTGTTVSDL